MRRLSQCGNLLTINDYVREFTLQVQGYRAQAKCSRMERTNKMFWCVYWSLCGCVLGWEAGGGHEARNWTDGQTDKMLLSREAQLDEAKEDENKIETSQRRRWVKQIDCGRGIALLKEQYRHYAVSWGGKIREVHQMWCTTHLSLGSVCLTCQSVSEGDKFITFQMFCF
jgi:hypothetical protein